MQHIMTDDRQQQLTLNIKLRDGLRFRSFYLESTVPDNTKVASCNLTGNQETVEILQSFIRSKQAQQNILWGDSQCGKTHLLQACCAEAAKNGATVRYLPLKTLWMHGPVVLEGLTGVDFIAVDDVDFVIQVDAEANQTDWERALFNLINQTRDSAQKLLLSSTENPRQLTCQLADLASRLIWGGSYRLYPLSDESKLEALRMRAEQRGFELSDRVLDYLYRRYPRDIESLMSILDKLDDASLKLKNRVTVPFVKQVLD